MEDNLEEQVVAHTEGTEADVEDNLEEQVEKQVEGVGNQVHGEPVHSILEDIEDIEGVSEYESSDELNSLSESSGSE